jgi:MFS family permease
MKHFYGWRVVFGGGTLQFFQSMLLNQAFGAYLAALVQDTGWSKTALSGAAALKSTESALLGPVLGWMVDRLGSQLVLRAGVILFGIGFMLLSRTGDAGDVLCRVRRARPGRQHVQQHRGERRHNPVVSEAAGAARCPHPSSAPRWAACSCLRSRGSSRLTAGVSPRSAPGVILIVCGWPLATMVRSRPEDVGQRIDGLPPDTDTAGAGLIPTPIPVDGAAPAPHAAPAQVEYTAREALRTASFWLLSLGHACSLFVVSAINVHAIVHIKEGLGYSLALASLYITIATAGQFVGVVCGWVIPERIEKRKVTAFTMLLHATGMLMLTYATGPVILVCPRWCTASAGDCAARSSPPCAPTTSAATRSA